MPDTSTNLDELQAEVQQLRREVKRLQEENVNQLEAALRASESQFHYIIKHNPNAIAVYDKNLRYMMASDRYLADYHVKEQDIIGRHHYEVFPEVPERWRAVHQRVLQGAIERAEEDHFVRLDGSIDYNRWECRPWYEPDGSIGGMITYTEVITERKQAEIALRESEQRARALAESIPHLVWATDDKGNLWYYNSYACRYLGIDENTDLSVLDWYAFIHPDDISLVQQRWQDVLQNPRPLMIEYRIRRASDGEYRWHKGTATPVFDDHERVLQWFGTATDIHDNRMAQENLRKREALLQSILDNSPALICIHDLTGRFLLINRAYEAAFGIEGGAIVGKLPEEVLPASVAQDGTCHHRRVSSSGKAIEVEMTIPETDQAEDHTLLMSVFPIRDAGGEVFATCAISTDITERKKNREELNRYRNDLEQLVASRTADLKKSQEKLRQSERLASLGTLASGIAHEINNPVGGILLVAQSAAAAKDVPATQLKAFRQIEEEAIRCRNIVQNIRRFAQTEHSEKEPTELNAVLQAIGSLTETYASRNECKIRIQETDTSLKILANTTALEQVATNLIQNSVQAEATAVTIRAEAADGHALLVFEDDGSGISPDDLQHLFDPFFTRNQHKGGTGLGLSIVHGIISDHGGQITATSKPGEVTRFIVKLPLWPEHNQS